MCKSSKGPKSQLSHPQFRIFSWDCPGFYCDLIQAGTWGHVRSTNGTFLVTDIMCSWGCLSYHSSFLHTLDFNYKNQTVLKEHQKHLYYVGWLWIRTHMVHISVLLHVFFGHASTYVHFQQVHNEMSMFISCQGTYRGDLFLCHFWHIWSKRLRTNANSVMALLSAF